MTKSSTDKSSDAARSDPEMADENREDLAKQAERGLKKAAEETPKGKPDSSR